MTDAGPDHLLNQNRHLLVEVDEPPFASIGDGIGPEDRGVDLGDRVLQRREPLAAAAAVGEEQALVLAGEARADAVLEQARAPDDERPVAEVVERDLEPAGDLVREVRVLEDLERTTS